MAKTQFMSNEKVLLAVGVTPEQIAQIKTADAQNAVNTLDAIHNVLMSYVSSQRIETANLKNPLSELEKGYAVHNNGSMNGLFQETLVQVRDKGDNGLYGGKSYQPSQPATNPWTDQDYGKAPIQFTYGINTKIERSLTYDRNDFLMALQNEALGDYISAKLATLEAENNGSRYIIENNVLNCEAFQYTNYDEALSFSDPAELNAFMHKVYKMQDFPEANMQYKRIKFNTTRGNRDLVFIFDSEFAFDFAQKYQFKQYLKPFMFRSEDSDSYNVQTEKSRIIEVDSLTPTTLADNAILNPLYMQAKALTGGKKLVGRIVDFTAVKFGVGMKNAITQPLDARKSRYQEVSDYVFNMCGAYVNVPIIINADFSANRVIHTVME